MRLTELNESINQAIRAQRLGENEVALEPIDVTIIMNALSEADTDSMYPDEPEYAEAARKALDDAVGHIENHESNDEITWEQMQAAMQDLLAQYNREYGNVFHAGEALEVVVETLKDHGGVLAEWGDEIRNVEARMEEDNSHLRATAPKPKRQKAGGTKNPTRGKMVGEEKAKCWKGYERVPGTKAYSKGSCRKKD